MFSLHNPQSLLGAAINDDKWPNIVYFVQNDEDYNVFFQFTYLSFDGDLWSINQNW